MHKSPHYVEYLIQLPQAPANAVSADTARKLVGQINQKHNLNLPMLFFGRMPDGAHIQPWINLPGEEGNRKNSYSTPPAISISGGPNFLRFIAIGHVGVQMLQQHLLSICTALSNELQTPFGLQQYSGDIDVEHSYGNANLYVISTLIVDKSSKTLLPFLDSVSPSKTTPRNVTLAQMEPLIVKAITRGIVGQALMMDSLSDSSEPSLLSRLPRDNQFNIQVLEGNSFFFDIDGKRHFGLAARHILFGCNLDLKGIWQVGQLRTRGYGLIRPANWRNTK